MGIHDRDYVREEPKGFFLGGSRSVTVNLVLVNVGLFLVNIFCNGELSDRLALNTSLLHQPWNAWQLLTYGFMHDPHGVWHVAFNMLALWWFGRDVEGVYGPKLFLQLYLSLVILSGLCWVLTEVLLVKRTGDHGSIGASGAVMGIMLVYVLHWPMRLIYIFWGTVPVPVWVLAALYVVQDLLDFRRSVAYAGDSSQWDMVAHASHLGGAAFGAVFYKTRWTLFSWLPDRLLQGKWRWRSGPKLRVHSPDRDDRKIEDRLDELLEKISREGQDSLTKAEKRDLEEASRRYQKRRS